MTLFSNPSFTLDLLQEGRTQQLPSANTDFGGFVGQVLLIVLVFAVLLLLVYLIWGAISWMSAGGDSSKVQQARDRITQAVIGLIILLSVLAIFNLIQSFFGLNVLNIEGSGTPTQPGSINDTACGQCMLLNDVGPDDPACSYYCRNNI